MDLMKEWAKESVGFGQKGTGTKILHRIGEEGDRIAATAGRARHKLANRILDIRDLPRNVADATVNTATKGRAMIAEIKGKSDWRKASTNSNELKELNKLQNIVMCWFNEACKMKERDKHILLDYWNTLSENKKAGPERDEFQKTKAEWITKLLIRGGHKKTRRKRTRRKRTRKIKKRHRK